MIPGITASHQNGSAFLAIGTYLDGGFVAGRMMYPDGMYYLIMPRRNSDKFIEFKLTDTPDIGSNSRYDGLANTLAINDADHPLAQYCSTLLIDGFGGWYIPAFDEFELMYRNFKPRLGDNFEGSDPELGVYGVNSNSVPVGTAHTLAIPTQTPLIDFQEGNVNSLRVSNYRTSTQGMSNTNVTYTYDTQQGTSSTSPKIDQILARPVKRIKI